MKIILAVLLMMRGDVEPVMFDPHPDRGIVGCNDMGRCHPLADTFGPLGYAIRELVD